MAKIFRILPGLAQFRHYRREWLPRDLVAGAGVTAVAVPVALAYAEIIGFAPVFGLYSAILPLLAYALFGTSRHMIVNPDAATCAVIAAALGPMAAQNPELLGPLSILLAMLTGVLCILGGLFRLGFVSDFLSRPILVGFLNGIAIHLFLGQIGKVFGFSMEAHGIIPSFIEFIQKVHQTHLPTLTVGGLTIAIMLLCNRFLPRLPSPLLAMIFAVALVYGLDLGARGVAVVGTVPRGLPPIGWPEIDWKWVFDLLGPSIAVALVSFSNAMVVARSFAAKCGDSVDVDKELFALGACQIAAGFSQGFAVSGTGSRTAINQAMGACSQASGLIAAGLMTILLFFTQPLAYLPKAALGAVLIVAAIGLFDARALRLLWSLSRSEFAVAIAAMLGVVGFGVLGGILVAIGLTVIFLLIRTSRPPDAVLGRVPGMKGFHSVANYPVVETQRGILLYRFRAAILFFNASYFKRRVHELLSEHPGTKWFIADGAPINMVDSTAADMLGELAEELRKKGVRFGWANLRSEVKGTLKKARALERMEPGASFPTLGAAMEAFRNSGIAQ